MTMKNGNRAGNKALALAIETARSYHDTDKPNASSYLGAFFPKLEGNSQRLSDLRKLSAHQLRERFLHSIGRNSWYTQCEFAIRPESPLNDLTTMIYGRDLGKAPFSAKEFHTNFTTALESEFPQEATEIPPMWNDYADLVAKHRNCFRDEDKWMFAAATVLLVFTAALLGPSSAKMKYFGFTRNSDGTLQSSTAPSGEVLLDDINIELVDGSFMAGSTFVVSGTMRHVVNWKTTTIIGREPKQKGRYHIEVEGTTKEISREHVEIRYSGRRWLIRDISFNGVFLLRRGDLIDLREQPNKELVLEPGDVIMLHENATGFLVQPLKKN